MEVDPHSGKKNSPFWIFFKRKPIQMRYLSNSMKSKQITTITIFRFDGIHRYWIFTQMQRSLAGFGKIKGLEFFKMLGSGGKNGFSKMLNLNVYAFLGVWESESEANDFFEKSAFYQEFDTRCTEAWTVFMQNKAAHGFWSGVAPFENFQPYQGGLIAVITRARIKLRFLPKFWSYVPSVADNLFDHEGSLFSVGIGELPLLTQATFSIWEDQSFMHQYAYKSKLHSEVIKKTRELGWYKEELFANFIPYRSVGTWEGRNPLEEYLRNNGY